MNRWGVRDPQRDFELIVGYVRFVMRVTPLLKEKETRWFASLMQVWRQAKVAKWTKTLLVMSEKCVAFVISLTFGKITLYYSNV